MYKFPKDPGPNLINKGLWDLRCMILSIHFLVKNMQKKNGGKNMYKIGKAQSILNKKTLSASPVQKVGEMPPSWLFASRSVVAKNQIYVPWHWICIDSWVWSSKLGPLFFVLIQWPSPWNPGTMICLATKQPRSWPPTRHREWKWSECFASRLLRQLLSSSHSPDSSEAPEPIGIPKTNWELSAVKEKQQFLRLLYFIQTQRFAVC